MENVLETVTVVQYPVIEQIKESLKKDGAMNALMSGSGATVFGLFERREDVVKALKNIKQQRLARQLFITEMYNIYRKQGAR